MSPRFALRLSLFFLVGSIAALGCKSRSRPISKDAPAEPALADASIDTIVDGGPGPDSSSSEPPDASSDVDAPLEPGEVVVFDPRRPEPTPRVESSFGGGPKDMPRAAQDAILARVFRGRRYLSSSNACSSEPSVTREIAPFLSEHVRGSFTAPGVREDLYLIWNGECGASHAESWGTKTFAVLRGGAVAAQDDDVGVTMIHGVFDLDGDGVEELAVSGGFTNQGFTQHGIDVVHFVRGKLTTLASFEDAYADSCAAMEEQRQDFLVIHAHTRRGAPPRFTTKKVSRPCP